MSITCPQGKGLEKESGHVISKAEEEDAVTLKRENERKDHWVTIFLTALRLKPS